MAKTEISGKQILDGSIELGDLSAGVSGAISQLQTDVAAKADSTSLATVATTGDYADLTGKPSLFSGSYTDLTDKPTLFSGSYEDLTNKPTIPSALDDLSDVAITSPSNSQLLQYNGTSWVNAAAPSGGATNLDELSDVAITSAARGQVLAHDGTQFVNTNTLQAATSSTIPLIAKGAVGHNTDFFRVTDSNNNLLSRIDFQARGWFNRGVLCTGVGMGLTQYDVTGAFLDANAGSSYAALHLVHNNGGYIDITGLNQDYQGRLVYDISATQWSFYTAASATQRLILGGTTQSLQLNTVTASTKGLVVKGAASQTANLLEVQNSSGTAYTSVGSNGNVNLSVASATDIPLTLKGAASQSSPLFQLQNSAGTQTMRINVDGTMRILQTGENTYFNVSNAFNESIYAVYNNSAGGYIYIGTQIYFGVTFGFNKAQRCFQIVPNQEGVLFSESIDGGAGKYTFLLSRDTGKACYNFAIGGTGHGFNFATANSTGGLGVDLTGAPEAKLHVNSTGTTRKGIIVRGFAAQTANLFEAQNSAGTVLASIGANGDTVHTSQAAAGVPLRISRPASHSNYALVVRNSAGMRVFGIGCDGSLAGEPSGWSGTLEFGNDIYQRALLGYHNATGALRINANSDTQMSWETPGGAAGVYYLTLARNTTTTSWNFSLAGFATSVRFETTLHANRYIEQSANAFDTSLAPSTGTLTVNTSLGNAVLGTLSASVTTWAFTNVPTDDSKVTTVTAVIAGNASYTYGDACSVNGTAVTGGIMWSGGSAPTATAGTDIITFIIIRDSAGTVKVYGSAATNFS